MKLTSYTIERSFAASPSRLYEAFTQPRQLAKWVWGNYVKECRAETDLRINGQMQIETDDGTGFKPAMRGIYLVIVPGKKLIHTVHWDGDVGYNRNGKDPVDEVVVVDFLREKKGCKLRYLHMGLPDDGGSAGGHEKSVRATLDFLERLVCAKPKQKRRGT